MFEPVTILTNTHTNRSQNELTEVQIPTFMLPLPSSTFKNLKRIPLRSFYIFLFASLYTIVSMLLFLLLLQQILIVS